MYISIYIIFLFYVVYNNDIVKIKVEDSRYSYKKD